MILGIGTDIVAVERLRSLWERHGERALEKVLAPSEIEEFRQVVDKGRFLAKRFAAKEAFAKALGTGVRPPATLPAIAVGHDDLGKPVFQYSPELAAHMECLGGTAHLSLSDEKEFAVAYVILEKS